MIIPLPVRYKKEKGFTLLESIIYIGLFSFLFTGIFTSMYPIFRNAEKLTDRMLTEGEVAFILAKIEYALSAAITESSHTVASPEEGTSTSSLTLTRGSTPLFRFEEETEQAFCTPPRRCGMITYSQEMNDFAPLNSERVYITDFLVTHIAPHENAPRQLDVQFTANGIPIGPVTYYLHF